MRINEENYVAKAESVILKLSKQVNKQGKVVAMVTNSKIRNLLSMSADIYNQVLDCKDDKLPQELNGRIEYLRVRYIYEVGREPRVKDLVIQGELLEIMKEIQGSKKNYILYYHYMEALVAFKRFWNKNDD
ncbi:MAG: type III-A CRISPR-associated protein Csm2 [Lachnospira sp.]